MYVLYSALLASALLISLPYWLMQTLRHGKYRQGLWERLGRVPHRLKAQSTQPAVWIHAVSVGEVTAIAGLVSELRRRHPQLRIVVSTTTDTGQNLARQEFGSANVFYFPMDFAVSIRPYLRALRPQWFVLAETEFWPNVLRLAHASRARIAVINARISDRSWPRYRRFRFLLKQVLRNVDLFLAQTEDDAQRLRDIGAPPERVQVAGNLKFDARVPAESAIVARLRQALQSDNAGPVLLCGSTVEGEEELLLQAFQTVRTNHPSAVMILAPRHPERFAYVSQLVTEREIRLWRRSSWNGEPLAGGVLLVDTIGELANLYALADLAFVGGSLVPRGGHNILEAARHGVAIVVGPYTENFRDIVRLFEANKALRVARPAELSSVFMELIANNQSREELGQRALATVRTQTGATQRTADALEKFLATHENVSLANSSSPAARVQ